MTDLVWRYGKRVTEEAAEGVQGRSAGARGVACVLCTAQRIPSRAYVNR